MDMEEILNVLYELAAEPDPARIKAQQQSVKAAEAYYEQLCSMAGQKEGDKIWGAALAIGADGEAAIFRSGLCLGVRLMTMCLG